MAALIERDHAAQAIEAYLCSQCDHNTDCDPECIACPHLDGGEILKSVPAVNRWIPCAERMPEQDTMVIVCYFGSDVIMPMQGETVTEAMARQNKVPTVTMGFLSEEGWNGADFFPMMVQPAFWMPLPDPPERSEEG